MYFDRRSMRDATVVALGVPRGPEECQDVARNTVNLVRLLREAESGRGLSFDFDDALHDALGEPEGADQDVRDSRKESILGLATRARSLNKKRSRRVVPDALHYERTEKRKQYRQELAQQQAPRRRHLEITVDGQTRYRPVSTAPLDGALMGALPVSESPDDRDSTLMNAAEAPVGVRPLLTLGKVPVRAAFAAGDEQETRTIDPGDLSARAVEFHPGTFRRSRRRERVALAAEACSSPSIVRRSRDGTFAGTASEVGFREANRTPRRQGAKNENGPSSAMGRQEQSGATLPRSEEHKQDHDRKRSDEKHVLSAGAVRKAIRAADSNACKQGLVTWATAPTVPPQVRAHSPFGSGSPIVPGSDMMCAGDPDTGTGSCGGASSVERTAASAAPARCKVNVLPAVSPCAAAADGAEINISRQDVVPLVTPEAMKLGDGLGAWTEATVAVGHLVDEDCRHVAAAINGTMRIERNIRRMLHREIGHAARTLPVRALRDQDFRSRAQLRGLKKAARTFDRILARSKRRAWGRWRGSVECERLAQTRSAASVACALARGYLARRKVVELRRANQEAEDAGSRRELLHRRMAKVAAASRVIASCLISHAAARRRYEKCASRQAVAMIERAYIRKVTRQQGLREIVALQGERHAASVIQRWARGALVRRRVPLERRVRRMKLMDARFAIRGEVFVAHMVEHGAAVVLQKWWRALPWRLRRLRRRYRAVLDKRASVIQRAYRRSRRRLNRDRIAEGNKKKPKGTVANLAILSSFSGARVSGLTQLARKTFSPAGEGGREGRDALSATPGARDNRSGLPGTSLRITGLVARGARGGSRRTSKRGAADELACPFSGKAVSGSLVAKMMAGMRGTLARGGVRTRTRAKATLRVIASPGKIVERRRKADAAVTVQGAIMIKIAQTKLKRIRKTREDAAAKTIQKLVREVRYNAVISRRRDLFKVVCRQAMYRRTTKGTAGAIITAMCKRHAQRRWYVLTRRRVTRCQAQVRGWLGRRSAERRRAYTQRLSEERAAGLVRWGQLLRRREEEEIVNGARSEDLEDDLELHKVFRRYSRFRDRRSSSGIQLAKLTALCKDAGITDKRLPVQRVEISFARFKSKDLSHLPYPSFLAVLDDLGLQHPEVRRLADAAAASSSEERLDPELFRTRPDASVLSVLSFAEPARGPDDLSAAGFSSGSRRTPRGRRARAVGHPSTEAVLQRNPTVGTTRGESSRTEAAVGPAKETRTEAEAGATPSSVSCTRAFRPEDQRLLVLLQRYILVKAPAGREICAEMQAEGTTAHHRALSRIEAAALRIQACLARGCAGRSIAREARIQRDSKREHARIQWAVTLVQTRYQRETRLARDQHEATLVAGRIYNLLVEKCRAFLARTRVAKLAAKRFYRCLDGLTGAEYYFDPKTGSSSWTKPKILGKFEIAAAVVVPKGEDIMAPICKECGQEAAVEICGDCDEDMYCAPCGERLHRTGTFTMHLRVPIDKCDECLFQVAIKLCKQCGDNFCASCFGHVHRKGRLRKHTFEPLVDLCHDCEERAQALRCFGCHSEGLLLLCKLCQDARHAGLAFHELECHRVEALGLRSLKVRRLKAERAKRSKEMRMKAELEAAGQRKLDARRLAAAIQIQAVWRGYLARKRKRQLADAHLLWRLQRLRDDQIRRKRVYKFLRFIGKAPLLKSDTNQEIVLKQYPRDLRRDTQDGASSVDALKTRWWQTTIIDIIRPGIGWHEGAKMVREQEFFSKKRRRKGGSKLVVARLKMANARRILERAKALHRKQKAAHARAAEAYRGAVGAQDKEALQQASRRAKRLAKSQQEAQLQAEKKLRKAEEGVEALIGPYRLRKTVRTALTEGILMPFPVSVQRGRAFIRLQQGQKMAEVLQWMPYGRRVRIEVSGIDAETGSSFMAYPPRHGTEPFLVRGVKESGSGGGERGNANSSEDTNNVNSRGVTTVLTTESRFNEGRASVRSDLESGSARIAKVTSARVPPTLYEVSGAPAAQLPCPLLLLNRQWLLPSAAQQRAYALPLLPLPQKISMIVASSVRYSLPVQTLVKAAVIAAHVHKERLERWQAMFDEDSALHARLGRWAAASESLSKSLMFRRQTFFDVDKGFDARNRAAALVGRSLDILQRLQEMAEKAKSAAATEMVAGQGRRGKRGGAVRGALDRGVIVQLFKKWVQSDDRDKVIVMHKSGSQDTDTVVEVVGYIEIDLDTPTPVLREFIRRYCGDWLNAHAKGDYFLMENSSGVLVKRSQEGREGKATAMDMVQERVNKDTRDTETVIFVQTEAARKEPDADTLVRLIPEADILDPEASPTFEDWDDEGGDVDVASRGSSARRARKLRDGRFCRLSDGAGDHIGSSGSIITDDEGDGPNRQQSGEFSSEHFSNHSESIGSMGSNISEHREDPFGDAEGTERERIMEEEANAAAVAQAEAAAKFAERDD